MKITNIDVQASNSVNVLNLNFRDPTNQSPYMIKDITGLDAEEIIPKFYSTDFSNKKYFDLSLNRREIVMLIGLNPNFALGQSTASLRDTLYKLIAASRTGAIKLIFKDGNATKAQISGFITKIESLSFTKTPEVKLTIHCEEGLLKATEETSFNFDDFDIEINDIIITDSNSTAPHGFRFGVEFVGYIPEFSIQDAEVPNWKFQVNLTGSPLVQFIAGDHLHFSSEVNNRYLYIVRGDTTLHLADRILPTSIWPIIFPGPNTFILSDLVIWEYFKYFSTYWGV